MEEKLKIEYTIISRGTEKYGSKGYMGISEVKKEKDILYYPNIMKKKSKH